MPNLGTPHGSSKGLATFVLSAISAEGASSEIAEICSGLAKGTISLASLASLATLTPAMAYVILLGGSTYVQWRAGKRRDEELQGYFADLAEAIRTSKRDIEAAVQMLSDIHSRSRFVWAKLDGEDKQLIAERVRDTLRPLLLDLGLSESVDLNSMWILASSIDSTVRSIDSKIDHLHSDIRMQQEEIQIAATRSRTETISNLEAFVLGATVGQRINLASLGEGTIEPLREYCSIMKKFGEHGRQFTSEISEMVANEDTEQTKEHSLTIMRVLHGTPDAVFDQLGAEANKLAIVGMLIWEIALASLVGKNPGEIQMLQIALTDRITQMELPQEIITLLADFANSAERATDLDLITQAMSLSVRISAFL